MKRARLTASQIVEILKEGDAGLPRQDGWRTQGIRSGTSYQWKARYGGLDLHELTRMRETDAENAKRKRM